jgi:hypothetical protein
MGASSDGDLLAIGNRRGALQRSIGNIEGENFGFGLSGYPGRHDTTPVKALAQQRLLLECH